MGVKVRQRDGAWWIFIDYHKHRKARRIGIGKKGKKAADLAAIKLCARLAEGDLSVLKAELEPEPERPSTPTFSDYAQQWLRSEGVLRLKPITVERYNSMIAQHLVPAFGAKRLPDITRAEIKTQLAMWRSNGKVRGNGPMRASSVRLLLAALRTILNTALDDGLIGVNPATRLGRHIRSDGWNSEKRTDPFTPDELQRLLRTTEQDYPEWHPFFFTLARTGLRVGECLALQPDDLDLDRGSLWVRRTFTRGRLGSPKGNRSRAIDLSPQTCDVLRRWLSVTAAEAALAGREAPTWVFPSPTGGPWDDRWLRPRIWQALVRRAGLRHRGMHQLRHTYASLLIAAGAHPKYCQAQLGHASSQITMDVYGHLFPGTFAKLVNALDDVAEDNPGTKRNPGATGLSGAEHNA